MRKFWILGLIALGIGPATAQTISGLPNGGLLQSTDVVPMVRNGTTMKAQPFAAPAPGSVMISTGTAAPQGIAPINNYCLQGVGTAWMARPCIFANTVIYGGTPVNQNLVQFTAPGVIAPADLSGDVTTAGGLATTVAAIGGNDVALGGAFTMSGAHTFTGTLTGDTAVTFPTSGTLSTTTGTVTSVTFTGDGTVLSSTPSSAVTSTGTLTAALAAAPDGSILNNQTGSSAAPSYTTDPVVNGEMDAASFGVTGTSPPSGSGIYYSSGELLLTGNGGTADFEVDGNSGNDRLATGSIVGAAGATNGPDLQVKGSDTNVAMILLSKGLSNIYLDSGGPSFKKMLEADGVSSSVDWWALSPSATGSPGVISLGVASGSSDTDVTAKIFSKGAGTVQLDGHIESAVGGTSAPTCGTGCSAITAGSTDVRGSFTAGSSVTSSVMNFGTTWATTPSCVLTPSATTAVTALTAVANGSLTAGFGSAVTSIKVYYVCMQ